MVFCLIRGNRNPLLKLILVILFGLKINKNNDYVNMTFQKMTVNQS